ncbi:MAG: response regulator transcription factor [Chloroflexi bacterium]|nr:response regulator transcription factor [Chloroflexota bacterium]
MARVLMLVEQQAVAELLKLTLNHGAFTTREASDATNAILLFEQWLPHLAVVEVEIGDASLIQRMVRPTINLSTRIPVLGLTRRGDLQTKLAAFDQGMDDIMTVPFSPEELLARVPAISRRAYGQPVRFTPVLKIGDLEIDILNRHVRVGEDVLHLTGLEQSLLYFLAANAGRLLTRDEIMDAIWGVDFVAESNIVDRHIRNLRVKLQNGFRQPRFITTAPGPGYRFTPVFPLLDHTT